MELTGELTEWVQTGGGGGSQLLFFFFFSINGAVRGLRANLYLPLKEGACELKISKFGGL